MNDDHKGTKFFQLAQTLRGTAPNQTFKASNSNAVIEGPGV